VKVKGLLAQLTGPGTLRRPARRGGAAPGNLARGPSVAATRGTPGVISIGHGREVTMTFRYASVR